MSAEADRILEILDHGLQRSTEAGSGFDVPGRCLRCFAKPAERSDLCAGCRAYLLGEGPDPRWHLEERLEMLALATASAFAAIVEIAAKILEAFDRIPGAVLDALEHISARREFLDRHVAREALDRHSLRAPEATPRAARDYHRRRT